MSKAKENEFAKQIHLPKDLKADLEVMAIREDFGNLKNMIETRTIEELERWKTENQEQ